MIAMTDETLRYRRVPVPLDGSLSANVIVPFVLDLASPLGLEIVLLRVASPMNIRAGDGRRARTVDESASVMTNARAYLATVAAELSRRGVRVQTRVRPGTPATIAAEILAAAREVSAHVIAMVTHGRRGLSRAVFGSIAEAVVRRSELPVFVMRLAAAEAQARVANAA
jgi:nucleotide-binding universal stress UspA family protein